MDIRAVNYEERLVTSEVTLPVQFFRPPLVTCQPERRLLLAVLENAVDCYLARSSATEGRGQRLYQEAEEWLMSTDTSWPFAYESICDVLGLDPEYLRRTLRELRERPFSGHARRGEQARAERRSCVAGE